MEESISNSEGNAADGIAFFDLNRSEKHIWQQNTVPFCINNNFSEEKRQLILESINTFHETLANFDHENLIKWKERTNERDFVEFISSKSDESFVGRQGNGRQFIRLSSSAKKSTIIHEMCHALGLYHEHQRLDRVKNRVEVQGENVNFTVGGFPLGPYDKSSIMHYPAGLYKKNSCIIKGKDNEEFGSDNMTRHDVLSLYCIYGKPCCTFKLWETPFIQPAIYCRSCGRYFCTFCSKNHKNHSFVVYKRTQIYCGSTRAEILEGNTSFSPSKLVLASVAIIATIYVVRALRK